MSESELDALHRAVLQKDYARLERQIDELRASMKEQLALKVSHVEYEPTKRIVNGLVSLILTGFLTALAAFVFTRGR